MMLLFQSHGIGRNRPDQVCRTNHRGRGSGPQTMPLSNQGIRIFANSRPQPSSHTRNGLDICEQKKEGQREGRFSPAKRPVPHPPIFAGFGPPVAQSSSSTVCTTATPAPSASCTMQPILPAAITSGSVALRVASLRALSSAEISG